MTEYEIASMISEYANRMWQIIQFWSSVSFGLIAICYLAQNRLSLLINSVITILYIAFSIFVFSMQAMNESVIAGFLQDLQVMIEQGGLQSSGAAAILSSKPSLGQILIIRFASIGTFIGTLFFLWYTYWKFKTQKANN